MSETFFENSIARKTGAVLVAALIVFNAVFPIPMGVRSLDEARYERAEAIAPAIPVICGTLLAACGVYVAGTTLTAYEGNLGAVTDDFVELCANTLYHEDIDAVYDALTSAVDVNGNIDLGKLSKLGILGVVPALVSALLNDGSAASSGSSVISAGSYLDIDGCIYDEAMASEIVGADDKELLNRVKDTAGLSGADASYLLAVKPAYSQVANSGVAYNCIVTEYYFFNPSWQLTHTKNSDGTYYLNNKDLRGVRETKYDAVSRVDGASMDKPVVWYGGSVIFPKQVLEHTAEGTSISGFKLVAGHGSLASILTGGASEVVTSDEGVVAGVEPGVIDGTYVAPQDVVRPFEPTADVLEQGYSSTDIVIEQPATDSQNISGILSGIGGLLAALNPLTAIQSAVANLVSMVSGLVGIVDGPFAWLKAWWDTLSGWWADLLSWLGDTPVGVLLAPLAGVATIAGALTGEGGIIDWLGTTTIGELVGSITSPLAGIGGVIDSLGGWWEKLMDWLGDTPIADLIRALNDALTKGLDGVISGVGGLAGALAGALSGVLSLDGILEAIGSIPQALSDVFAGSLEGIDLFPDFDMGEPVRDPVSVDVPQVDKYNAEIGEKAPWAYMVALFGVLEKVRDWNDAQSFYVDLEVPSIGDGIGTVSHHVDFGDFLLQEFNGLTVAFYIRSLLTILICVELLMFSYRIFNYAPTP